MVLPDALSLRQGLVLLPGLHVEGGYSMKLYRMYAEYMSNPVSAGRKASVELETIATDAAEAHLQFMKALKDECGDRLTWHGDAHEMIEHPKVRMTYYR